MSAIRHRGSLVFRLYEKRIASTEVIEFFYQMLCHHPRRPLVVVMDRATPHPSQATQRFIASQKLKTMSKKPNQLRGIDFRCWVADLLQ
jgi:hypothetical protein